MESRNDGIAGRLNPVIAGRLNPVSTCSQPHRVSHQSTFTKKLKTSASCKQSHPAISKKLIVFDWIGTSYSFQMVQPSSNSETSLWADLGRPVGEPLQSDSVDPQLDSVHVDDVYPRNIRRRVVPVKRSGTRSSHPTSRIYFHIFPLLGHTESFGLDGQSYFVQ
jgi:hypothetical protein